MATKFSDISKGPNDLLGDDFPSSVTLKAKVKAGKVGVTIETEKGEKGLKPKVGAKFAYAGFNVDKFQLKADASSVFESSVKLNPETKLAFKFNKGTPDLYVDYSKDSFYATGVVTDITQFSKVATTACLGHPSGFKVGMSGTYVLSGKSPGFSAYDFGTSYASGPGFASVPTASKFSQLNIGATYKVTPEITLASSTTHKANTPFSLVAFGGLYKAPYGDIKAKYASDGKLYASFVKEIVPKVKVTAAVAVSTSNVSDIKTGLGIEI